MAGNDAFLPIDDLPFASNQHFNRPRHGTFLGMPAGPLGMEATLLKHDQQNFGREAISVEVYPDEHQLRRCLLHVGRDLQRRLAAHHGVEDTFGGVPQASAKGVHARRHHRGRDVYDWASFVGLEKASNEALAERAVETPDTRYSTIHQPVQRDPPRLVATPS